MNPMEAAPKDREILVKLGSGEFCVCIWCDEGSGVFSFYCDKQGEPVGWYELPGE